MELKEEILYMCGVGLCVSRKTILALLDDDVKKKKASELIKFGYS